MSYERERGGLTEHREGDTGRGGMAEVGGGAPCNVMPCHAMPCHVVPWQALEDDQTKAMSLLFKVRTAGRL